MKKFILMTLVLVLYSTLAWGGGAVNNYVWDGSNWVPESSSGTVTISSDSTVALRSDGSDVSSSNPLPVVTPPLSVSTYSSDNFINLGASSTGVVKASAGNVFSLSSHNDNSSARYVQLHNLAANPTGGAVPVYTFLVPGDSQIVIGTDFFTDAGSHFTVGIAFSYSATKNTFTPGSPAEQTTMIQYK